MSSDEKKDKKSKRANDDGGGRKKSTAPKKANTPTTMRSKYEKSIPTKQTPKKPKETRKVTGLKDPCVLNMDQQRAADLGLEVGTSNENTSCLKRKAEHTPALHLLPLRRDQTADTLAMIANRLPGLEEGEQAEVQLMVVDEGIDLHKEIMKSNEEQYRRRNETAFPLEALASLGLLSSHTPTVDQRQSALSAQYGDTEAFMRDQLSQITRLPSGVPNCNNNNNSNNTNSSNTQQLTQYGKKTLTMSREVVNKKRRTSKNGASADSGQNGTLTCDVDDGCITAGDDEDLLSSSVKLSHVFAPLNLKCSYIRRASNEYKNFIYPIYDRDKEITAQKFYINDQLEEDVPTGSAPARYKMFQQLVAANAAKYEGRDRAMRELSSQVPRPSLEQVNRAYIKTYRYRPVEGDQLCFNGTRCYFYTFASNQEDRYIGRVFRTPQQLDLLRGGGKLPETTDHSLCIDCLLASWTRRCIENINKGRAAKMPMNHFTVLVGKHEYNQACMLQVVFNTLPTGIVGCVPRYDEKNRTISVVTDRRVGQLSATTSSYVAEIGMDF